MAPTAIPASVLSRRDQYLRSRSIIAVDLLGDGKDGYVWLTSRGTAVKIHVSDIAYRTERDAYIRLRDLRITEVAGFTVPTLAEYDDQQMAIEMDVVFPPSYVDFASALFDVPPDFIEDDGHTFEEFICDRFDDRADQALDFYHELAARTGIYLPDLHRENMKFA